MHGIPSSEILNHTREIELDVISIALYEPQRIYEIEDLFDPAYFYFDKHKKTVSLILERFKKDINLIDVQLMAYDLQEIGLSFTELVDRVPSFSLVKYYAEKVKALYLWREARNVAASILTKGDLIDTEELQSALADVQEGLVRIEGEMLPPKSKIVAQKEAVAELQTYLEDETPDQFLLSGLNDFDTLVGGFKPSQLIVIGGRPSMGKTAISMTFLESFSKQGKRTLFFSEEMKIRDMMKRMAAQQAMVSLQKIDRKRKDGTLVLDKQERTKIYKAMETMRSLPIMWHHDPITTREMKNLAKHIKRERGLDCIIIDHLGEIVPDNIRSNDYEKTSQIARDIRDLCKELDVTVILLSQLSRAPEMRNDKRPNLGDLRESGKIEEVADLVVFLYRDEYYYPDETEKKNIIELIVSKNRNGATGTVEAIFLKEYAKVVNLASNHHHYDSDLAQNEAAATEEVDF